MEFESAPPPPAGTRKLSGPITRVCVPRPPPPRSDDIEGMLDCLIDSGNVPNGWVRGSDRVEMCRGRLRSGGYHPRRGSGRHRWQQPTAETGTAGWGILWSVGDQRSPSVPAMGPVQTAPRAEWYAVAKVLTMVRDPMSLISESTLAPWRLQDPKAERPVAGRHQEHWAARVPEHIHKLSSIAWVKARIEGDESRPAARGGGRLPGAWALAQQRRRRLGC